MGKICAKRTSGQAMSLVAVRAYVHCGLDRNITAGEDPDSLGLAREYHRQDSFSILFGLIDTV